MIKLEDLDFKQKRLIKYLELVRIKSIEELLSFEASDLLKFKNLGLKSILEINDALIRAGFNQLHGIDTIHQYVEDEKERIRILGIKQNEEHERYIEKRRREDEIQRKIDIPELILKYKQKIIDLKIELKELKKKYD